MSLVIEDPPPELKEGEIICPKCKGKYCIENEEGPIGTCNKCHGKGKLDWVSNAMGKGKHPWYYRVPPLHVDVDGPVTLYYNGVKPIKTTSNGIKIWGQNKIKK